MTVIFMLIRSYDLPQCFAVRSSQIQDEVLAQQMDSSSRADDSDGECVQHAHERASEQLLNAKLEGNEQDEGGLFCAVEPYLSLSPKSKQVIVTMSLYIF